MPTVTSLPQLSSLTQWSQEHIRDVFESATDEKSIRGVDDTFSKDLSAMLNGKQLGLVEMKKMVSSMRMESQAGLRVEWQQTVEVPEDSSNRDGLFGGVYIIHGIRRILPGQDRPLEFARHKTVTVRIESQSADPTIDSRKIVNLVFVASDIRVNEKA